MGRVWKQISLRFKSLDNSEFGFSYNQRSTCLAASRELRHEITDMYWALNTFCGCTRSIDAFIERCGSRAHQIRVVCIAAFDIIIQYTETGDNLTLNPDVD